MASTGLDSFDNTIQITNEIFNEIETYYGWEDRRNQSYNIVRSVLHAIRDRLMVNDAAHFAAQLPLMLKGVFYDGWDPTKVPVKMSKAEFVNRVRESFPFSIETDLEELIKVTIDSLKKHLDSHQLDQVQQLMPDDLKNLFNPNL